MPNTAIRHHYIPQFILRNFAFSGKSMVHYIDKCLKQTTVKDTRDVFMEKNLYKDFINNTNQPTKIENDLARFESEIALLLNNQFINENKITLNNIDYEKLMIFFALMALRANSTFEQFKNFSNEDNHLYNKWQGNNNMGDLWKRNLGFIVNCRTFDSIMMHTKIDNLFKVFIQRDIIGLTGKYISVIESNELSPEFIIGDTYPVVVTGGFEPNSPLKLHLYSIFPISPRRAILIISNGADSAPRDVTNLNAKIFEKPTKIPSEIIINVKHARKKEVSYLNRLIFKEANNGVIYRNEIFDKLIK